MPQWWKLRRRTAQEAAQALMLDPAFRMWLIAVGRAYQGGHANFEAEELRTLVPKMNRSTGETSLYSDRQIGRLIKDLIEAGILAPASNRRCLVIPFTLLNADIQYSPVPCPEHGHDLSWTPDGWIDPVALVDGLGVAATMRKAG
ncbi:hypothetical protein [Nonomuraea roseoviolacea]|uniref:Uncharacterized protein n=1 Tax=Nonomuraea roseoviolacea subsp. carminata TaxID=160689 RepID=A0ABT1K8Z5_9ACTN|nr:hypothetical protein [Nonomuraea roseoviolacea]MCP2350480.1 hypothetical protein [Nonomuraea roseoviolacea subsp. carminata]